MDAHLPGSSSGGAEVDRSLRVGSLPQHRQVSAQADSRSLCTHQNISQPNDCSPQLHLRDHHLRDGAAGRGHRVRHHSRLSQEDKSSGPTGVRCHHAGLSHLHLPHLRGGQEEHLRSLCKRHLLLTGVCFSSSQPPGQ